jgi:hypothetical protein
VVNETIMTTAFNKRQTDQTIEEIDPKFQSLGGVFWK